MRNSKTNELVLTGLFTAIIIIMAFTPLGYIPLVVINATIIHIPVILGSLFCGPKKGAFLGFLGKMSESLSQAAALGIGIAVGAVVFIVVEAVFIRKSTQVIPFVYAGVAGAMTNTLLVMGSIFVLYKDAYADAIGVAGNAVLGVITGVISFNGVIEAIVAAIIVYLVGLVLNTIKPIAAK